MGEKDYFYNIKNLVYCGFHRFEEKITKEGHSNIINISSFNKV